MGYVLQSIAVRTDNSQEGMERINALWGDIMSGRLPILYDSEHHFQQGISPVSRYCGYESDQTGSYDLYIIGVTGDFFEDLEREVRLGKYKRYDEAGDDLGVCAGAAWSRVWEEQANGVIQRAFSEDYESTVPAECTADGKARCTLYIAVKA